MSLICQNDSFCKFENLFLFIMRNNMRLSEANYQSGNPKNFCGWADLFCFFSSSKTEITNIRKAK